MLHIWYCSLRSLEKLFGERARNDSRRIGLHVEELCGVIVELLPGDGPDAFGLVVTAAAGATDVAVKVFRVLLDVRESVPVGGLLFGPEQLPVLVSDVATRPSEGVLAASRGAPAAATVVPSMSGRGLAVGVAMT